MSRLHEPSKTPLTGTLLRSYGGRVPAGQLDLRAYLAIVAKHQWGIILFTLTVAVVTFLYATSLQPRFRASASMLYDPPSASNYGTVAGSDASNAYGGYFRGSRMFKTQRLIVGSKSFVEKMVDHYKLWGHPHIVRSASTAKNESEEKGALSDLIPQWFSDISDSGALKSGPAEQKANLRDRYRNLAIATIQSAMLVDIDEEVMMLTIAFISSSPEFAKEMANKLSEFYSQYELEQRVESYNRANAWLVDRTKELRDQLMISEQALQDFRAKEDVGLAGGQVSIASKRLENVFTDLSEARRRAQSLSQTLNRLQRKNNNFSQIVDSAALLKFSAVRAAMETEIEARKEREQLALEYGPRHPNMINSRSKIDRLQQKLNSEIKLALVELRADLNTARSDERRYSSELEELKKGNQSLQNTTFRLTTLERARDTDQQLYDLFATRFKELNVGNSANSSSVRVLSLAQLPGAPYWPKKGLIVSLVSLLTLALSVGLAFLQELFDNTITIPDEVEDKLHLPLLASLVHMDDINKRGSKKAETFFLDQQRSPFAESIRTIRTGVMLSGLDNPYKVIAVNSTLPAEGKTTVSMNLAAALGQLERVLIIDADMRRPSVGPQFGIPRSTPGLADVVAGLHDLSSCLLHFKKGNIDVLTAGTLPPNPQELLSSKRFRQVIQWASKKYDRVIIDTTPTHLVSDAKLVARSVSAIIYVVKADSTPINIINQEIHELKKANTPFIGIVLNFMSKKKMQGLYQYGRYSKKNEYGYGYGYGQQERDDD
jgi:succinoglycan biosynthesis transport protein ExoP